MIETDDAESIKAYWKKPGNKVAVFTLLAVLAYTGVQIAQTWIISSNNVVSQRALVFATAPNLGLADDPITKVSLVTFQVPLENSGNTATKNLNFFVRCAPSVDALPEPWVLLYREAIIRVPQFIAPHQLTPTVCTFTRSQMEDVRDGKVHAYVMGDITYFDRLDSSALHRSEFEWEVINVVFHPAQMVPNTQITLVPETVTLGLVPRGQHNCADEECPTGDLPK